MNEFQKRQISLRYWLLGKGYLSALSAMEFGQKYHVGFRKDGVTPEFDHQISIAHFVRTLPELRHQEETLSTVFLHDVREDYHVSDHEIRIDYNDLVANAVEYMTKTFRGVVKNENLVFEQIAADPIASIAKGADRVHNFGSMVGVFSIAKQKQYLDEGEEFFLPMLKKARRNFPDQEAAYEIIKHMLLSQIELIRAIHIAAEKE